MFWRKRKKHYICPAIKRIARVLSSVGSEHLVYTQRVGGSNPSGPTPERSFKASLFLLPKEGDSGRKTGRIVSIGVVLI